MKVWTRQWQDNGKQKWVAVTGNQAIVAWVQNLLLLQKGECYKYPDLGYNISYNSSSIMSDLQIKKIEEMVSPYVLSIRIMKENKSLKDNLSYKIIIIFLNGEIWNSGKDKFNQSFSQTSPYRN